MECFPHLPPSYFTGSGLNSLKRCRKDFPVAGLGWGGNVNCGTKLFRPAVEAAQ